VGSRARGHGYLYEVFRGELQRRNKTGLRDALDTEAVLLAKVLHDSSVTRLAPYWHYLLAFELIDPSAPVMRVEAKTWTAVQHLCIIFDLPYKKLRREIMDQRATDMHPTVILEAKANLLRYHHTRRMANIEMTHTLSCQCGNEFSKCTDRSFQVPPLTVLEEFAMAVFSTPIKTVFVESHFNIMKYNKSKKRFSLGDERVADIIQTRSLKAILRDPGVPFFAESDFVGSWTSTVPMSTT
jgi:hypothetical protein